MMEQIIEYRGLIILMSVYTLLLFRGIMVHNYGKKVDKVNDDE